MFVIKYKNIFFAISGLAFVASIIAMAVWGLRPSVDFTGGSVISVEYAAGTAPESAEVSTALTEAGFPNALVRTAGENQFNIRTRALVEGDSDAIITTLSALGTDMEVDRLSSVGPTVGQELRKKTMIAISLVVVMIILYVAFAFRHVSKPISSWRYGLVAIITLVHDVVIPAGVFAALGHFAGLEADTLFVVGLLTILGLSVNDTIVVFDRIRENLRTNEENESNESFDVTVGKSLEQTYVRSFNTSFTLILVLLVLFYMGGSTIHSFMLVLLVGTFAGTYSSLFIASPLLVVMGERKR